MSIVSVTTRELRENVIDALQCDCDCETVFEHELRDELSRVLQMSKFDIVVNVIDAMRNED